MKNAFFGLLVPILSLIAVPAVAQGYGRYGQQEQVVMYNMPGNSRAPAATVIERGLSPSGIPTSGVRPIQLDDRVQAPGPTMIYQTNNGRTTVIAGPNGNTYCRKGYGSSVVCY